MALVNAFTSCPLLSRPVLIRRFFDCRRRFPQNLQQHRVLAGDNCARAREMHLCKNWSALMSASLS